MKNSKTFIVKVILFLSVFVFAYNAYGMKMAHKRRAREAFSCVDGNVRKQKKSQSQHLVSPGKKRALDNGPRRKIIKFAKPKRVVRSKKEARSFCNKRLLYFMDKGDMKGLFQLLQIYCKDFRDKSLPFDVNLKDKNSWALLHHAVWNGWVKIVEALLHDPNPKLGAVADIRGRFGLETPMHLLARRCLKDSYTEERIATLLIQYTEEGVDIVNMYDCFGQSSAYFAKKYGNERFLTFLESVGADVSSVSK